MKIIKKILLGSEGFFGQTNTDLFIDVSLERTLNELRTDRFNNDFDIERQFQKERNSSRDFFIYGIIDSITDLGNDLTLDVYKEEVKPIITEENLEISSIIDKDKTPVSNGS